MARIDVTVRGAGIFGLSVAYACLQSGARVRVVDPHGPGAGASGGLVGALAPHVPEGWNPKKAFQFESLILSRSFWPEVEALSGLASGYAATGRLQPLADARAVELARAREAGAAELWEGKAAWQVIPAAEAGAWVPPSPSGVLVRDTLTARLHPAQAVASLAAAVQALGGEVVREAGDEGAVVWATGAAGLETLSRELGRNVGTGVKGQAAVLDLDVRDAPQLFVDGLHVVPHGDGTTAVGSTSERDYADPSATDAALDDVVARARAAVPALAEPRVLHRWAGVRPRAKSRAPMLGAWPDRPGHFIANGGFKIGFGIAPLAGQVMADLVLEGRGRIPEGFGVAASLR